MLGFRRTCVLLRVFDMIGFTRTCVLLRVFDMIYLLTAIALSPGGSTHLHTNNT